MEDNIIKTPIKTDYGYQEPSVKKENSVVPKLGENRTSPAVNSANPKNSEKTKFGREVISGDESKSSKPSLITDFKATWGTAVEKNKMGNPKSESAKPQSSLPRGDSEGKTVSKDEKTGTEKTGTEKSDSGKNIYNQAEQMKQMMTNMAAQMSMLKTMSNMMSKMQNNAGQSKFSQGNNGNTVININNNINGNSSPKPNPNPSPNPNPNPNPDLNSMMQNMQKMMQQLQEMQKKYGIDKEKDSNSSPKPDPRPSPSPKPDGNENSSAVNNNPKPFPLKDGATVQIPGTEGVISKFRIGVIGNPDNIKNIYFANHGDSNSDYFNKTKSDRDAMAKRLKNGEGAVVAYPINTSDHQGTFANGKNGEALLNAYRHLEKMTGNNDVKFEQFSLSGGGRVNNALMNLINKKYDSDPNVKEFVDNHLRGIHDGDSLCRDIPQMKQNFKDAIKRFPQIKFSFIHNTSGEMKYVQGEQNEIASYVKNNYTDKKDAKGKITPDQVYKYGGNTSLENGRLRFWAAPDHWKAWKGQFEKVFFGS